MANGACDRIGPPPKANVIPGGHALPEEALAKLYLLFRTRPGLKQEMPVRASTKAGLNWPSSGSKPAATTRVGEAMAATT